MSNILKTLDLSGFTVGIYFLILSLLLIGIIIFSYDFAGTSLTFDIDNTGINAITYIY